MKKFKIKRSSIFSGSLVFITIFIILSRANIAQALTPGTIVYRTTEDGKMFGYSKHPLLEIENDILIGINPGHAGIYIGNENGVDYIVEALAGGIVKTPAKYFVNEALKEELVAVRLPREASALDRLKAVTIAKNLVGADLDYDLDFQKQKGPGDGDWTCVGLTEKIYESAGIANPGDISSLVYDPAQYKIDITPDGFDNREIVNDEGDCVSTSKEFSKIARREDLLLPAPEILGYNAGREYRGERYFFLPYTQLVQPSLKDEKIDIELSSSFDSKEVRGKTPVLGILLRWSLINNPTSTIKNVVNKVKNVASNISTALFGKKSPSELVLTPDVDRVHTVNNNLSSSTGASSQTAIKINSASKIDSGLKENNLKKEEVVPEVVPDKSNKPSEPLKISVSNESHIQAGDNKNYEIKTESAKVVKANSDIIPKTVTQVSQPLKTAITKITSSTSSPSATTKPTSSVVKIEYSPTSSLSSRVLAGVKPAGAAANNNSTANNTETSSASAGPTTALISKIYATDNNDFIELYNPLDYDFDLAEEGFRLEKTKTAEDPSLIVRIGNETDGYYPKGTVIKAKSFYLIVRDDASKYYLDLASAVITRSEFSWTDNAYTIYLGKGAISSSTDVDIVDAVGFGAAKYFQGVAPASAITDNYFLDRVSNKNDNSLDFRLQVISDPSIVWENSDNNSNDLGDNNQDDNEDNTQDNDDDSNQTGGVPADFMAFTGPTPLVSNNISDLWHFDECYGESHYAVGKFGCGLELRHNYTAIKPALNQSIDLNQATISFYYRGASEATNNPRFNLKLKNTSGQTVWLVLDKGLLQIEGLPNTAWRYFGESVSFDDKWHSFSLVVNKEDGYWAAYFDGLEKYRQAFVQTLPDNFNELEIYGDMHPVLIDELAIWGRALSVEEISDNWQLSAPFSPVASLAVQVPAELKYFWDFNEGHELINEGGGIEAIDEIAGVKLTLPENSWVWRGTTNTAIVNKWGKDLSVDLEEPLGSKDMSLAFWWRSQFYPNEGRSLVSLQSNDGNKFGLAPDQFRRSFYFNNAYGIFSEGNDIDLPLDEKWHHFVLTYDSYRYQLKMYIDGTEKREMPFYWVKDGEHPNKLVIKSELNSIELDDLGIWEGSLTPLQISEIFTSSRVEP